MQTLDKGKQNINELLSHYGPVGPRHLLAAALLMRPREEHETEEQKAERARLGDKVAA
ncbi:MAG: hypothetical protein JWM58_4615 [Rhizobium sp.]|nr:hypothetical protein [Rhizobium sp.]